MTHLESLIFEVLKEASEKTKTEQNLSKIKTFLNSSGEIVDTVNNLGDTLNANLKDSVGGLTGKLGGWVAGKTTKVVGGFGAGVMASTLKTIASVIPDKGDIKGPNMDKKISQIVGTYALPMDKNQLVELLQFISDNLNVKEPIFGEKTLLSLKKLHEKTYDQFCALTNKDEDIYKVAKMYAPKKKFGFF